MTRSDTVESAQRTSRRAGGGVRSPRSVSRGGVASGVERGLETEDGGCQTYVRHEHLLTFQQPVFSRDRCPERWTHARGRWR